MICTWTYTDSVPNVEPPGPGITVPRVNWSAEQPPFGTFDDDGAAEAVGVSTADVSEADGSTAIGVVPGTAAGGDGVGATVPPDRLGRVARTIAKRPTAAARVVIPMREGRLLVGGCVGAIHRGSCQPVSSASRSLQLGARTTDRRS